MTEEAPTTPSEGGDKPCPVCGKPAVTAARPFCSRRCADLDLHRWLGGRYTIPAQESAIDDRTEDDSE